jgi:hypothetical protein
MAERFIERFATDPTTPTLYRTPAASISRHRATKRSRVVSPGWYVHHIASFDRSHRSTHPNRHEMFV